MLEQIELERQQALLIKQRLEAIDEGAQSNVRAIKTYIRTKSGRLVEKIVFLSEDEYREFLKGGENAEKILKKNLTEEEAAGLQSWEKEEQKAITTLIRTKSGRLIKKTVYVSKDEYEKIKKGKLDVKDVMKKYIKDSEGIVEGWEESEMKAVKTLVRTKSGRLIEKTILVSKEDYEQLKAGGDASKILGKYMSTKDGAKIEGWKKDPGPAMKAVKIKVRTKSGRLIEKTILMSEKEYKDFMDSGGDLKNLRKFIQLDKDDVIEGFEDAGDVYANSEDEEILNKTKEGGRFIGKDGAVYEVVVDPLTGKKYKKYVHCFVLTIFSNV